MLRLTEVMRCVYTGQAGTLKNVQGNDLCVILVTLYIHIQYDTWHMICLQSAVTFATLISCFPFKDKEGLISSEFSVYRHEL